MIRKTQLFAAASLAAAALAAAGTAQASQVFSDNFNTENGGVAARPYSNFANWTVVNGAFTLDEGLKCDGGSGGCVGLDGPGDNSSDQELRTTQSFNYGIGSVVTLTYAIAGNHADCDLCARDDEYEAGFVFSNVPTTVDHFTIDGFDNGTFAEPTGIDLVGDASPLAFNAPWATHTISFVATDVGSIQADFTSFSVDGTGPLLDDVTIDITQGSVPEPAGWALMILGFGAAGAALRRRTAVA